MVKQGYKQTEIGVIPEDWEVIPLSNVFSYISYGFTNPMPTTNSGPWMVTANDVKNGRINYETARKTSEYAFKKLITDKSRPKIGDLLLTKDGTLGRVAIVDKSNICINQSVAVIRTNDKIEVNFLKHLLQDNFYQKVMIENAGGSTIKHIYITVVDKMPIVLPPLPEQEAIAEALSDADAWIESLEQLIAKKRLIKQGAMQELLTPKEDWEVKKLGDIGKCLRGVSYSGDSDLFEADSEKSIKLLRSNNIYSSKIVFNNIQNVNKHKVKEHQIIQKSDILICMANGSKELVGKAGFCNDLFAHDKYTFGAFMGIFRIYENVDPYFIFLNFLSKNYRNFIDLLLSGSSINNLKPSDIEQIEIKIPSLPEQTRIATILSDMDAELEALEKQLGKARQIKQGMMQELLTGRVRLL